MNMSRNTPKKTVAAASSPEFLKKVKVTLLEQKATLEGGLAKFAKKDKRAATTDYDATFPNYGDSEEDNAREVADYEANLSIEHDMEKTLRDVDAAIRRIAKGTYGVCKYCGKPIDAKRMLARPTSSACVECKKTIQQEV